MAETDDWTRPAFLSEAHAWIEARLDEHSLEIMGELEQPHLQWWSTVLRVPTSGGDVFFKASRPDAAFEGPLTSLLAEVCRDAGVPDGVFNVVNGFGPEAAGEALTRHPDVSAVTFTGESNTGKAIMAAGAGGLKKLSFELGGKSPSIVCADADLDAAVNGSLLGVFLNQGEVCLAGTRILVQRPVYEEFCARMVDGISTWKVGDPFEDGMREVQAAKKLMKQSLLDVPPAIVPALEAALPLHRHTTTSLLVTVISVIANEACEIE